MKKFFYLLLLFFLGLELSAQQNEIKHTLRTSNTSFGLLTLNITDNYISPLPYNGVGLKIMGENGRLYSPYSESLSVANRYKINAGTLLNSPQTASMMFLGLNFAWGMHYHFRPIKNLQILTGGLWEADFGFKYNARNVNNPFNMDLSTNLNLSAIAIYDIPLFKRTFRLQAQLETPWIGCMFAPEQGSSYYEIFSLGASGKFVHFSSFHNKQALHQTYSVEIPLINSSWRFGLARENSKYTANNMVFKNSSFTLFLGYTHVFSRFTRKNPAPRNFVGY